MEKSLSDKPGNETNVIHRYCAVQRKMAEETAQSQEVLRFSGITAQ